MKPRLPRPPHLEPRHLPKRELTLDQLRAEWAALLEGQGELETSLQQLSELYDQLPIGYVTLDTSGCLRDLNLAGAALLGLPRRQLLDRPLLPMVAKQDRRKFLSYVSRLRRAKHPVGIQIEILTRQGSPVTLQLISVPGGAADGPPRLFRTALVDTTNERKADEALHQAQQRLDLALKASGAVTWNWNVVDNRFEDWSPEYRQLYGFAASEPPRLESWLARIHAEDRSQVIDRVRQMLTTPVIEVADLEFRILHPERGERWIGQSDRSFCDAAGHVQWMTGVDRDITEQKRTADRSACLLEVTRLLSQPYNPNRALARLAGLLVPAQADWCFIDLLQHGNPVCRRVAARVGDPARREYAEELKRDYAPDLTRPHPVLKALETGKTQHDLNLDDAWPNSQARDARHRFLLSRLDATGFICVPLKARARVLGTLTLIASRGSGRRFTLADVSLAEAIGERAALAIETAKLHSQARRELTQRTKAEQTIRRLNAKLERRATDLETKVAQRTTHLREMVAELQQLAYAIDHDMRPPLRAMTAFTQALQDRFSLPGAPDEARDYCQRILTASSHLDKLIQDALQYIKSVLQELPMEPVNLAHLVHNLILSCPILHADHADIRIDGELPVVLGSTLLLTQCFSNLLGTAVKFVPAGTRPVVRVWADTAGDTCRVWVQDNGVGIPKRTQARLFGSSQKLDDGDEVTGIGLAIVRKVVERMNGRVGVDSEAGRHTRFWVELPLATANAREKAGRLSQ